MQLTTLRLTWSKKRTSKGLLLALVGVWGCAPGPELVYVDVGQATLHSALSIDGAPALFSEGSAHTAEIPDLSGQDLYIGSAEQRAIEALELFRRAQQRATEAVFERLKNAYMTEAALFESSEASSLDAEYAAWLDEAMAELHETFVLQAELVEPLRYRLTKIVGFPDPDPGSVKVPLATNEKATRNFEAARDLRQQIAALDAAYKKKVEDRLSAIEERRDARLRSIGSQGDVMRAEALRRAHAEADAVSQVALAELERTALDPEARLAAVPGASSSVNSGPLSVLPPPSSGGTVETKADVEAQLEVFLKVHGYRLSRRPAFGRDATQEFLQWRRKYVGGP